MVAYLKQKTRSRVGRAVVGLVVLLVATGLMVYALNPVPAADITAGTQRKLGIALTSQNAAAEICDVIDLVGGVTAGTASASKAVVLGSSSEVDAITITSLTTNEITCGDSSLELSGLTPGGSIVLAAQDATSGTGGSITGTAGAADGSGGNGGAITFTTGAGGGGGTAGAFTIGVGAPAGGTGAGITIGLANATATTLGTGINYGTSSGTDTIVLTLAPALTRYLAGQFFIFKPGGDNTGACTLNVNGLGAKNVKTQTGADPSSADVDATGIAMMVYDGTNMVLINPATTTD